MKMYVPFELDEKYVFLNLDETQSFSVNSYHSYNKGCIIILVENISFNWDENLYIFPNLDEIHTKSINDSPVQHEGWMVSGKETIFYWVSIPLTMIGY
jgi:hypothetical protein